MKVLFLASLISLSAFSGCCTTGAKTEVPVNDDELVDRLQVREPRIGLQE